MLTTLPALSALARRDAAVVEDGRRLTPDVAEGIVGAGFPRHFVPKEQGGDAGGFAALLEGAASVAETCASTSWCAALYAAHGRLAAFLPGQGQREVWAQGPGARISASIVPPQGRAVAGAGGWRLDGEWVLASGVDHADWLLLAAWTYTDGVREHRIFAVPRSEADVRDTWHTVGLRGTGSNTVTVHNVEVPLHRTVTLDRLIRTGPDAARCHTVPYPMVAALMFAAPVLGAARGALRAWTDERQGAAAAGSLPNVLARASAQIDAAGLLLERAARRADHADVTPLLVAENRRDAAMAADLCREAVERLFHTSGVRAQREGHPVQRAWRDVVAAAGHGALGFDTAADVYARESLIPAALVPGGPE